MLMTSPRSVASRFVCHGHADMWFSHPTIALDANGILADMLYSFSAFALFIAYELWMNKGNPQNKNVRYPLFVFSGFIMYLLYGRIVKTAYALPYAENIALMLTASILPYLLIGACIYLLNKVCQRRSFMPIFLLGAIAELGWVLIMVNNHIGSVPSLMHGHFSEYPFEMFCPLIFLVIITGYTAYHKVDPRDKVACLVAFILWFIITFGENVFDLLPSLIMCAVAAWLAYKAGSRKWFNTAVLMAVVRILAFYANVKDMDLQHAGIYLIGSGVLIIAVILLLMKYGRLLWEKKDEK